MSKNKKVVDTAKKALGKQTIKQKKFTAEIIKSLTKPKATKEDNATQAAIKAGYSKKSARFIASENLTKPNIIEPIKSAAEKLGINPEFILGNLKKVSDVHSKTIIKTLGHGDNVYTVEEMIDSNAVIKANEMLGKHLKLFADKVEIDAKIEEKTDDDVKKQIARKLLLALQNPDILGDLTDL